MAKDRKDDLFRRSFEAGTAFLDMTRERAEALVKDFVKAGEISKGKAQKLVDEVLERSRKGSEELRELIRREMAEQVSALGLATKDDIARLESRLDEMSPAGPGGGGGARGAGPAATPTATKGSPVSKSSPRKQGAAPGTPPMAPAPPAEAAKKAATKARAPRKTGAAPAGAGDPSGGTAGTTPTGGPPANGPARG